MINSYKTAMRNYATFSGRMSRAAYWQFVLVYVGLAIVAFMLDSILGTATPKGGVLIGLVAIVHLIPNLASLARRLHDSDKSALWLLIMFTGIGGLLILIFACLSGTSGPNRFGEQPTDALFDNEAGNRDRNNASAAILGAVPRPAQADIVAELERLAALRSNGSLSDSEYEVMKSRLMTRGA
jgi:uncharacterized membrane protein YhaH (DUF805 family)